MVKDDQTSNKIAAVVNPGDELPLPPSAIGWSDSDTAQQSVTQETMRKIHQQQGDQIYRLLFDRLKSFIILDDIVSPKPENWVMQGLANTGSLIRAHASDGPTSQRSLEMQVLPGKRTTESRQTWRQFPRIYWHIPWTYREGYSTKQ
jgi:hypothetical protein